MSLSSTLFLSQKKSRSSQAAFSLFGVSTSLDFLYLFIALSAESKCREFPLVEKPYPSKYNRIASHDFHMVALIIFNSITVAIFVLTFCSCLHPNPDVLQRDHCLLTLHCTELSTSQYITAVFIKCHFFNFGPVFSLERSALLFFYFFLTCPPKSRQSFSANFVGASFIPLSKLWLKILYIESIEVQITVGINRLSNY